MSLQLRHVPFLFLASEQISEQWAEVPVDKQWQRALGAAPVLCPREKIEAIPEGPAG